MIALAAGGRIELWDPIAGRRLRTIGIPADRIRGVALSPDGELVAGASSAGSAGVWRTHDGREISRYSAPRGQVFSVDFDPSGKLVVSAGDDGKARVFKAATGRGIATFDVAAAAKQGRGRKRRAIRRRQQPGRDRERRRIGHDLGRRLGAAHQHDRRLHRRAAPCAAQPLGTAAADRWLRRHRPCLGHAGGWHTLATIRNRRSGADDAGRSLERHPRRRPEPERQTGGDRERRRHRPRLGV